MPEFNAMVDELALETESLARDLRVTWYGLSLGDRVSYTCACAMLLSVFLPWITLQAFPTAIGLTGGGILHVHLALLSMRLKSKTSSDTRHALCQILCGAASVLVSIGVLIYYDWLHLSFDRSSHVRYGFYLATASGLGIAVGGIFRFFRSCPNDTDG